MLSGTAEEDPFAGALDVQAVEAELLRQNNSRLHTLISAMRGRPESREDATLREEMQRQNEQLKKMYEDELQRAADKVTSAKGELQEHKKTNENLLRTTAGHMEQLAATIEQRKAVEKLILQLHQQQEEVHVEAKRQKLAVDEEKKRLADMHKSSHRMEKELDRVRARIAEEGEKRTALSAQHKQLQDALQATRQDHTGAMQQLQANMGELRQAFEAEEKELRAKYNHMLLQALRAKQEDNKAKLQKEHDMLAAEMKNKLEQELAVGDVSEQLGATRTRVAALQSELDAVQARIAEVAANSNRAQGLLKTIEETRDGLDEWKEKNAMLQESSMEEIAGLRARLQSKEQEVAEAMQDKWALGEELDRFSAVLDRALQGDVPTTAEGGEGAMTAAAVTTPATPSEPLTPARKKRRRIER